jgi:hypothetical protein
MRRGPRGFFQISFLLLLFLPPIVDSRVSFVGWGVWRTNLYSRFSRTMAASSLVRDVAPIPLTHSFMQV